MKKRKIISYLCVVLFLPVWATAATYYVKQTSAGGDTGADCANAKALSWFNSNGSANDTAYLCAGTFTTQIAPTNSGTSGNYITYQRDPAAAQWSAVISTSGHGVDLDNDDYIKIDGLFFDDVGSQWIEADNGSDYLIVQNCRFYDAASYSGIRIDDSNYGQFIDNLFDDAPDDASDTRPADLLRIQTCYYFRVIGNTFNRSSHGGIAFQKGDNHVVRDNISENEYHTGGGNASDLTAPGIYLSRMLWEDNVFKNAGSDYTNNPNPATAGDPDWENPCVQIVGQYNIVRYNSFATSGAGLYVGSYDSDGADRNSNYSRIYHNTAYNNFRNIYMPSDLPMTDVKYLNNILFGAGSDTGATCDDRTGELFYYGDYTGAAHVFTNNAMTSGIGTVYWRSCSVARTLSAAETAYPSELYDNISISDPYFSDPNNGDFGLTVNSTALIDAATHLTQVNDSGGGSGTSMVVDDSLYFYDGWSIPGETGDTIYVDNPSSADFEAVISSINYGTHTLTLTASKTWDDDALVYFCPSGTCFEGSAPDIGMNEYDSDPPSVTVPVPSGRMSTGGQGGFGTGYGRLQ